MKAEISFGQTGTWECKSQKIPPHQGLTMSHVILGAALFYIMLYVRGSALWSCSASGKILWLWKKWKNEPLGSRARTWTFVNQKHSWSNFEATQQSKRIQAAICWSRAALRIRWNKTQKQGIKIRSHNLDANLPALEVHTNLDVGMSWSLAAASSKSAMRTFHPFCRVRVCAALLIKTLAHLNMLEWAYCVLPPSASWKRKLYPCDHLIRSFAPLVLSMRRPTKAHSFGYIDVCCRKNTLQ